MFTHEEADYRAEYSKEKAKRLIEIAREFQKNEKVSENIDFIL